MRLSNPWRMGLLFAISGLTTGMMLGRVGLVRERSKRLLLPLLFGMALIVPPQAWLQVRDQLGCSGSYLDFLRVYFSAYGGFCRDTQCLVLPTWNHLWFLPYLWCYTMLLLLTLRLLPQTALQRAADTLSHLSGWRLLVLPVLLLGSARALRFPHFGETHALLDDWAAHAGAPAGPALAFTGAGSGSLGGAGALPRHAARLACGARGLASADARRVRPRSGAASSPSSASRDGIWTSTTAGARRSPRRCSRCTWSTRR